MASNVSAKAAPLQIREHAINPAKPLSGGLSAGNVIVGAGSGLGKLAGDLLGVVAQTPTDLIASGIAAAEGYDSRKAMVEEQLRQDNLGSAITKLIYNPNGTSRNFGEEFKAAIEDSATDTLTAQDKASPIYQIASNVGQYGPLLPLVGGQLMGGVKALGSIQAAGGIGAAAQALGTGVAATAPVAGAIGSAMAFSQATQTGKLDMNVFTPAAIGNSLFGLIEAPQVGAFIVGQRQKVAAGIALEAQKKLFNQMQMFDNKVAVQKAAVQQHAEVAAAQQAASSLVRATQFAAEEVRAGEAAASVKLKGRVAETEQAAATAATAAHEASISTKAAGLEGKYKQSKQVEARTRAAEGKAKEALAKRNALTRELAQLGKKKNKATKAIRDAKGKEAKVKLKGQAAAIDIQVAKTKERLSKLNQEWNSQQARVEQRAQAQTFIQEVQGHAEQARSVQAGQAKTQLNRAVETAPEGLAKIDASIFRDMAEKELATKEYPLIRIPQTNEFVLLDSEGNVIARSGKTATEMKLPPEPETITTEVVPDFVPSEADAAEMGTTLLKAFANFREHNDKWTTPVIFKHMDKEATTPFWQNFFNRLRGIKPTQATLDSISEKMRKQGLGSTVFQDILTKFKGFSTPELADKLASLFVDKGYWESHLFENFKPLIKALAEMPQELKDLYLIREFNGIKDVSPEVYKVVVAAQEGLIAVAEKLRSVGVEVPHFLTPEQAQLKKAELQQKLSEAKTQAEAESIQAKLEKLREYFLPRRIKDYDGFVGGLRRIAETPEHPLQEEAAAHLESIARKEKSIPDKSIDATEEKRHASRKLEGERTVSDNLAIELKDHYMDPADAMMDWIHDSTTKLAEAKFFGAKGASPLESNWFVNKHENGIADKVHLRAQVEEELAALLQERQSATEQPRPLDFDNAPENQLQVLISRIEQNLQRAEEPLLPAGLKKASPNYGYGQKLYQLTFETDTGKALYIIGGSNKSKAHAAYLQFLEAQPRFKGLSAAQIENIGTRFRNDIIKPLAKKGQGGRLEIGKEYERYLSQSESVASVPSAKPQALPKKAATPEERTAIKEKRAVLKGKITELDKGISAHEAALEHNKVMGDVVSTRTIKMVDKVKNITDEERDVAAANIISYFQGTYKQRGEWESSLKFLAYANKLYKWESAVRQIGAIGSQATLYGVLPTLEGLFNINKYGKVIAEDLMLHKFRKEYTEGETVFNKTAEFYENYFMPITHMNRKELHADIAVAFAWLKAEARKKNPSKKYQRDMKQLFDKKNAAKIHNDFKNWNGKDEFTYDMIKGAATFARQRHVLSGFDKTGIAASGGLASNLYWLNNYNVKRFSTMYDQVVRRSIEGEPAEAMGMLMKYMIFDIPFAAAVEFGILGTKQALLNAGSKTEGEQYTERGRYEQLVTEEAKSRVLPAPFSKYDFTEGGKVSHWQDRISGGYGSLAKSILADAATLASGAPGVIAMTDPSKSNVAKMSFGPFSEVAYQLSPAAQAEADSYYEKNHPDFYLTIEKGMLKAVTPLTKQNQKELEEASATERGANKLQRDIKKSDQAAEKIAEETHTQPVHDESWTAKAVREQIIESLADVSEAKTQKLTQARMKAAKDLMEYANKTLGKKALKVAQRYASEGKIEESQINELAAGIIEIKQQEAYKFATDSNDKVDITKAQEYIIKEAQK